MNQLVSTTGFSLAAYGRLLDALRYRGYAIVDYEEAEPAKPQLILRHDVDVCVQNALTMAEYEAAQAIRSTYFVLLRSPLYNLLSPENLKALQTIAGLGHRVGLHFDATLYRAEAYQDAIARECEALENLSGTTVDIISFHRPAQALLGYPDRLAGRFHAYMPRFFSDMGYCSDSRGGWYRGAPLDHPAVDESKALQLVTHPIWWIAEEHETAIDKLDRLVASRDTQYREALAANITPYQEVLNAR